HAEMLVLLGERIPHDRFRRLVLLDGDALLVPADGLRLLREAGAHPGEGPGLLGQFSGRLVVLVGGHGVDLLCDVDGGVSAVTVYSAGVAAPSGHRRVIGAAGPVPRAATSRDARDRVLLGSD